MTRGGSNLIKHRQLRLRSTSFAFVEKYPVDFRILILVLDLRATFVLVLIRFGKIVNQVLKSPGFQRDETRRIGSRTKMLMVPIERWHNQASRSPINPLELAALWPH